MRTIRDCNVAVVGGAGFLGSHLVDFLIEDCGCKVLVIDNLAAGKMEFVHKDAYFVHHDITGSEEYLLNVLFAHHCWKGTRSGKADFLFNYAAYPYVPDSFSRPLHVCDVNFMGAVKVINAAQEAGCEGILQVSSAEIYGSVNDDKVSRGAPVSGGIMEDYPVNPHSSYGASKAAVDAYVQVAWRERKTPCIALRQFNCVGERETHPYVVPEIISQITNWMDRGGGRLSPTVKLGNNSFRDFLYAGDQARIAVELLERGQFGEVYNLGSETGIKVYDLAKMIGKVMGFADVRVEEDEARKRPWEIWHLQSDNSKIKLAVGCPSKLGLQPLDGLVTLEDALRRTVRWFEEQGRRWPWERDCQSR